MDQDARAADFETNHERRGNNLSSSVGLVMRLFLTHCLLGTLLQSAEVCGNGGDDCCLGSVVCVVVKEYVIRSVFDTVFLLFSSSQQCVK